MGKLYRFLTAVTRAFSPKMKTVWETEFDGAPSIFCPNHAGALGPIEMCSQFPLRDQCHPWLNQAMMDPRQVPAYVRQDYWWRPGCFWEPVLTRTVPYLAALALPPVLRSAEGVPVYHDMRVLKTFRQSVERLKNGEHLVIFAQQPNGYCSHEERLNSGFLQIAPMAYKSLGIAVKFYPVHIDCKNHVFTVGAPAQFDPDKPIKDQSEHILEVIRAGIFR